VNRTWIGWTLCGLLSLPAILAPVDARAAESTPSTQTDAVVEVDLELRKGESTAKSSAIVHWGTEAQFEFEGARQVKMTVAPGDADGKLRVQLSLSQRGKTVAKSRLVEADAGKTQEVDLGKGTVVSLKLSPKHPHRIVLPDSDEPLAGLD
jgi:hypothetical protein